MSVETTEVGDVLVVTCSGPLTAPTARTALLEAMTARLDQGQAKFALDLRDVPYMDSPSIGAMMSVFKQAMERGGGVKIVLEPKGKTREIFELTGLDSIIEIFEDPQSAVASLGGAEA